jgi:hypothetical protein
MKDEPRNRRDVLKMTTGFATASIGGLGSGPALGQIAVAGAALSFFADERDVPILLNRLNSDPDIAFIVPDGPLTPEQVMQKAAMEMMPPGARMIAIVCIQSDYRQHWRAVRPLGGLNDGAHSLWHVPAGPLPLLKADGNAPNEPIPDPWAGWTEERPGCQPYTPYFGPACPAEIRLKLWTRRDRGHDRLTASNFQWTGGPPQTGRWWNELEGWFRQTATGLRDSSDTEVFWAFPSALRELKEGTPYHANGFDLGESIRRAVTP